MFFFATMKPSDNIILSNMQYVIFKTEIFSFINFLH